MTATFAALNGNDVGTQLDRLDRMLERAHGGHAQHASILETLDRGGIRTTPVTHRTDPITVFQHDLNDLAGIGLEHVKVDPELALGTLTHLGNRGLQLGRRHGRCSQKSKASSVGGSDHQFGIGDPAHRCLNNRIVTAEQLGQPGFEHAHALTITDEPCPNKP